MPLLYHLDIMRRISPVWILTTLRGEEFKKIKAEIDSQFGSFSETELDGYKNDENHKWWEVTSIDGNIADKWNRQTGTPNNIPAFENIGLFDGTQVIVIFHSPLSEFEKNVCQIKTLKEDELFLNTFQNRLFYGIISFRKEESVTDLFENRIRSLEDISNELFDAVVFHSDSSQCSVNTLGYLSLSDDDFRALSVNLIFSTALLKITLASVSNQQNRPFHTAGCFSLIYEPDAFKCNKSANLAALLMNSFCENETDPEWFNQNEAIATFENSTVKKSLHWYSVYNQMHSNFKEEKLDSIFVKPHISPWAMLAYKLKPEYFKKYLRSLLRTVYDKIHDYGALTLMRFKSFTDLRYQQLIEGSAPVENGYFFSKKSVSDFISGLWSPDNKGAKGLKQAQLMITIIKDYLKRQKEEIDRVKEWKQPNDKDFIAFPKPNDYPLHEIFDDGNKQFTSHYDEEATNHPLPSDNTSDINKRREINELTDVHRIMQYHPMPLNLFVKVALVAALLPTTIWVLLMIIPNYILNSAFFESGPGLTIMYLVAAGLILIIGSVQYARNILHNIRTGIRKYVAWYYYQIERQTYLITLQKESEYYDEMLSECERVETHLKSFIETDTPIMEPFEKYNISKFQRNILENLDNGIRILDDTVVRLELKIEEKEYALDTLSPNLFKSLIESNDRNMGDTIVSILLKEVDTTSESKRELMTHWASLLAKDIHIYINGKESDNDIAIPAFYTSLKSKALSNFDFNAMKTICATFYPSVFIPTIPSYNWTNIFVSNLGGAGRKWESLYASNVILRIPDYTQGGTIATFEPAKIAIFTELHSFQSLFIKDGGTTKTIFN